MSLKGRHQLAIVIALVLFGGIEVYVWRGEEQGSPETPREAATAVTPMEYFPHLRPGDEVVAFEAERLEGGTERIEYPADGPKTYLFVLSLTCGTCAKTIPKWNRLAQELDGSARVFGIVLGSYQREQQLLKEKGLAFPAIRFPSKEIMQQYKASKVPQTILVAPGGTVESNRIGELTDDDVDELLARAAVVDGASR